MSRYEQDRRLALIETACGQYELQSLFERSKALAIGHHAITRKLRELGAEERDYTETRRGLWVGGGWLLANGYFNSSYDGMHGGIPRYARNSGGRIVVEGWAGIGELRIPDASSEDWQGALCAFS